MDEKEIFNAFVVIKKAFKEVMITNMDLRHKTLLTEFKTHFSKTIVKPRLNEMGTKNYIIRVGYGNLRENIIQDFTECLTEDQWSLAHEKLITTNSKLVVIVNESFVISIKETKKLRSFEADTEPVPVKKVRTRALPVCNEDGDETNPFETIQPPIEESATPIFNEDTVLPEELRWVIETDTADTVPADFTFENEVIMDVFDDTIPSLSCDGNLITNEAIEDAIDSDEATSPKTSAAVDIESEDEMLHQADYMQEASRVPLEQSASCLNIEASERFKMAVGDLWFSQAKEVVVRLQNIIEKGFLPTDHILYLILHDVISFVDVMHTSNEAEMRIWEWNKVVKDFFSSVHKVGGKRTINLLRGPGNLKKGSIFKNFDIGNYNIPLPHLKTLKRQQSGYTPRSGIYLPYLKGFIEKSVMDSTSILEYENVMHVFVCRGVDGFGLKAGCNRDQRLNELIGMDFVLDINWITDHSEPDLPYLKEHLIREAEPEVLTTLDGKVAFPVGVNYLTEKMKHEQVIKSWKENISIIETCLNCLKDIATNDSVIVATEKACSSYCAKSASNNDVCDSCSILGYTSVETDRRQCTKCIGGGVKCVRLKCAFTASDCGSPYKKAIIVFNEEMDNESVLSHEVLKGPGAIPDIVHICKCLLTRCEKGTG